MGLRHDRALEWIPAFAGMTEWEGMIGRLDWMPAFSGMTWGWANGLDKVNAFRRMTAAVLARRIAGIRSVSSPDRLNAES